MTDTQEPDLGAFEPDQEGITLERPEAHVDIEAERLNRKQRLAAGLRIMGASDSPKGSPATSRSVIPSIPIGSG